MVDWKKLFAETEKRYLPKVKGAINFPIIEADIQTLNEEMGKFTFNQEDSLLQLANQLKTQSPLVGGEKISVDKMKELLDELAELAGISNSNNINLCLMGGT